jgi:hypothetical protein
MYPDVDTDRHTPGDSEMSARHRSLLPPVAAVLLALTACSTAVSPTVTPSAPALPSTAPASAPASPATAPTSAPASTTAPAVARPAVRCPSAKALEKLSDLPADWHFVPSSVECWKGWATADPKGPADGDGIYLFQYRSGGWRYHSQGSGYHCKEIGIDEAAPFCQYP